MKEEITVDTTGVKTLNGLKIKSIEIEGKYGTYIKGSEGIKIKDKVYKDIAEVDAENKDFMELADRKEKNIKEQIEKLTKDLECWNKRREAEDEICEEIKAVFEM